MTAMPTAQKVLTDRFLQVLRTNPHIRGAWVTGSLARNGDADRHSDIDLHIWLEPSELGEFKAGFQTWLAQFGVVLLHHELFGGDMIVALLKTEEHFVMALDIWIEARDSVQLEDGKSRILFERDRLIESIAATPPDQASLERSFDVEARYFWRLFAMLPSIERDELIPAVHRLSLEVVQLVQVCSIGRKRPRDVGEKRATELLTPTERRELEAALVLPELTPTVIVLAHLRLAVFMQNRGRLAATEIGAPYPAELETAVMDYVLHELDRMNLPSHQFFKTLAQ
jgi:predicted nucleotidyltransferase